MNEGSAQWIDEVLSQVAEDYEAYGEEAEEWEDEEGNLYTALDVRSIQKEIDDLESFRDLAISIRENAKGEKLLTALEKGFERKAEALRAIKQLEAQRNEKRKKLFAAQDGTGN